MNCAEARELIQLYLDDELSSRDALVVQQHLDACSACASLLDYFSKQDAALRASAKLEPANNELLAARIRLSIRKETAAPRKRLWWSVSGRHATLRRVAALVIVAVVIAFFLLRGTPINDKVYADAVLDHADHCAIARLSKAVSDPNELNRLVEVNSALTAIPDLSTFGYANPRAVICRIGNKKVLHLVYQSDHQQPLSLFMRMRDERLVGDDLVTMNKEGYRVASVSKAGTDLLVVASLDEKQTAAIANAVASHFSN
ncbi:MAG: DUF3379 family protein [Acidobacteriota bacterium]